MNRLLKSVYGAVIGLAIAAMVLVPVANAQIQNPPSNLYSLSPNVYYNPAATFTATSQTSVPIAVLGASAVIEVSGTALTTVTWAVKGSFDGGATFVSLPTAAMPTTTVPITTTALTQTTTTANTLYVVSIVGAAQLEFVTSGTFTATSVAVKVAISPHKGYL